MSAQGPRSSSERDACAREPIHLPASIQPDGVLLAVEGEELIVRVVSQSVEAYFGRAPAAVLERPLAELAGHALAASLRAIADSPRLDRQVVLFDEFVGGPGHLRLDAVAHRHAGRLLLELEQRGAAGEI